MTGSQSRIHRASGRDKVTDTHENRVFVSLFLVCVNLIIQIFIYTVRKNLLIFISSPSSLSPSSSSSSSPPRHHEAPPGTPTQLACYTPVSRRRQQLSCSSIHPRKQQKGRAGWDREPACTSGAWQPHHPLLPGLTLDLGRCLFLGPLPSLAILGPHQLFW